MKPTKGPPRLATWLLTKRLPAEWRDFIIGDLEEEFRARRAGSLAGSHFWFWWQTMRCLVAPPPVRRPSAQGSPGGDFKMRTFLDKAFRDARHAVSRMRRNPGFTAGALLVLALGIGTNALIFGVVNAVFFRPIPYFEPDRLVWVTEFFPKFNRTRVPAPDYVAWKRQSALLERMEAMATMGANLTVAGRPGERVEAAHVTPGFFTMLGIPPQQGTVFQEQSGQAVTVVSHNLWRGFLQGDPGILGKTIRLNAKEYTVIGVMPRAFVHPGGAEVAVWLPDAIAPADAVPGRQPQSVHVIGRLRPRVTAEQARAELERIARTMDGQYPAPWAAYHAAATVQVMPLRKQLAASSETAAAVLMGAVGFLLLIACGNVANLFLARTVMRRKEIAMRIAIGAARSDIVRMLLAESLVLGAMGGLLGTALFLWGRDALKFLVPQAVGQGIPMDWRVLGFTAVCSVAAGLLFGLAPALAASRIEGNAGLKETAIPSGGRLQALLAAGQIALSVVLLAGAGLLIRSLLILTSTAPGFDARNVLMATAMLRPAEAYGPEKQVEFGDRMIAGIEKLAGVRYAAVTSSPPMAPFSALQSGLRADDGRTVEDAVSVASISPEYFRALGIPLVSGRFFDSRDIRSGAPVAIVNQTLARMLFPGRDPLGRRIGAGKTTVVGVVADIRHRALDDQVWPALFLPFRQVPSPWVTVLVRGWNDPSGLSAAVRWVAHAADSSQPLFDVDLLEHRIAESLAERRERAAVLGALATLALLIAGAGIYGVMSCFVAQRTREIGLRMAVGADRGDVLRMVAKTGMSIAGFGISAGLAGALLITRVLGTFLHGIEPHDGVTYLLVCAVLGAAVFLASYVPARRAATIDPIAALRRE